MISVMQLRRFSESPIPRRLINYLRNQISRLRWRIVPVDGVTLSRADLARLRKLTQMLTTPNPDDGWRAFIGQVIEDMLVIGWGPVEIKALKSRELSQISDGDRDTPAYMLWPFDGSSLMINRDWDGSPLAPRYVQVLPDGKETPFRNSEIVPFKWTPRTNTPFGLAPIEVAMNEIDFLLNANSFAGRTASNANPKKALWIKNLTTEQRRELSEYWRAEVEGSGSIPFLGGEAVQSIELGLITDQNLFLKWQEFLIAIIASAFGIDVQKCNLIVGINRSTGDKLDDVTDEGSILPLADMIEETINTRLLPLFDLHGKAEFRFYPTATSDRKALATYHQVLLQADTITIDEARTELGYDPLVHPETGESIGHYTLSAYRKLFPDAASAVDGPRAALEESREKAEEAMEQAESADESGEKDDADLDPAGGGNNGVWSAKKPKDKPLNRADEREESSGGD